MTQTEWIMWIRYQDHQIKKGLGSSVKQNLFSINTSKVPDNLRWDIYDLARRLHMSSWILKVLHSDIEKWRKGDLTLPDQLIGLYGLSLNRLGLFHESNELFKNLNLKQNRTIIFYYGASLLHQWNYPDAIKIFRRYIKLPDLDPYSKLVGKLNLAACLLFTYQHEEAQILIEKFFKFQTKYPLLYGNALELSAQSAILQKDFSRAQKLLDQSKSELKEHPTYIIWVQKWQCILDLLQNNLNKHQWNLFYNEMGSQGFYEVQRDLFYFKAFHEQNQDEINYLYWGTPYPAYQKKIQSELQNHIIPTSFLLPPNPANAECIQMEKMIDIQSGLIQTQHQFHTLTSSEKKIWNALTKDFFRPLPLPELFEYLYEGEYFNIYTSPDRIRKALVSFQNKLKKFNVGWKIEQSKSRIKLVPDQQPATIRLCQSDDYPKSSLCRWAFQKGFIFFRRQDVEKDFLVSSKIALKMIHHEISTDNLRQEGSGSNVIYHLTKKHNIFV